MSSRRLASAFRFPELFELSLPWSVFGWLGLGSSLSSWLSHVTAWWNAPGSRGSADTREGLGGSAARVFEFVVDDVLWILVTVLESLALVVMLCFFFVFCGCTL
ncbi:hypothetical protein SAY86_028361 [Trapa natans]|uniref:Transmembrane protein n=1 Tax=Trapa natans TaxID=22666 RepID=A0AAN7LZL3_TRANT|nr:hypothetical protein SAY86_028361 [Trapa natans]